MVLPPPYTPPLMARLRKLVKREPLAKKNSSSSDKCACVLSLAGFAADHALRRGHMCDVFGGLRNRCGLFLVGWVIGVVYV